MAEIKVTYEVIYDDTIQPLEAISDLASDAVETLNNLIEYAEELGTKVRVIEVRKDGKPWL